MSRPLSKIIGFTFLTQVTVFFLVVFNNVLVSRWLGPAEFGMTATLLILAETVNKFVNLGQETSLLYFTSNKRFPFPALIRTLAVNGLGIYLAGVMLIFAAIYSGALKLFFDAEEFRFISQGAWWCIFLLFAAILHEYGSKVWLGQQKFKSYNGNLLVRPLIYLVLLIGLYLSGRITVVNVVIIYGVSWLLPGLYIWATDIFPLRGEWKAEIARASLQYGTPIMFSNLLAFLIYRVDIYLIGYFLSQKEVGWYYVSVMIVERLFYLTHATGLVLMPAAAHAEEQRQKTPLLTRVNLWVVFLGAVLLGLLAPYLIPLVFSEQYAASVTPLMILLPGIVALTIPKMIAADLLARGLPRLTLYGAGINFVINIVLNVLLIPRMGINGAALSSTISYTVGAAAILFFYCRESGASWKELLVLKKTDFEQLKKI